MKRRIFALSWVTKAKEPRRMALLRDEVEPDLDLVELGSVGGGEVDVVAGPGGEEGGGAVANIAVRHPFDMTQPEGHEGLGALQGLGLALLVDAQDHRMVGRMEVEADDVADLLDKEGIGGELEVLLPVELEVERGSETLDRGLRDLGGGGHGAAGPVCTALGGTARERHLQQRKDTG